MEDGKLDELISRVQRKYPDWEGFDHPKFVADEIAYKRKAASKASELLSPESLSTLIENGNYYEYMSRLEQVANATNLLYMSTPQTGDLGILYGEGLDKEVFCRAFYHFIHGDDPIGDRLADYLKFLKGSGQAKANKWAFPTYYLFLCHPNTEFFVKPTITKDLLNLLGKPKVYTSKPRVETYLSIRNVAHDLLRALEPYGAKDMIDVQSLVWVAMKEEESTTNKTDEFRRLFEEFLRDYVNKEQGRKHLAMYRTSREEGQRNFQKILEKADAGEIVTEDVLQKLLPHTNSAAHRDQGSWISIAPAIQGDIKEWFQNIGWVQPEAWPAVSEAILTFLRRASDPNEDFRAACDDFADRAESKGLKAGMLSPILNALNPNRYFIVNNKTYRVLNHFQDSNFKQSIRDYPQVIEAEKSFLDSIQENVAALVPEGSNQADLFDAFVHWLVAVKKYFKKGEGDSEDSTTATDKEPASELRYWKISPGERAFLWDEWKKGDYVAIGWDDLGDLSGMTLEKFEKRREITIEKRPDWAGYGINQVWAFANDMKEGDRVVINRGKGEVLAVGTITGPYYFEPHGRYAHRRKVRWDDLTPKQVNESGWQKTLILLSRNDFIRVTAGEEATEPPYINPPYTLKNCAEDTSIDAELLARWVSAIERKGQAVIYGPPGTGKTYVAERLARHIVGGGDGIIELVQFHPAYAYEDFIQGIRPQARDNGSLDYSMVPGRFLDFCHTAASRSGLSVLIIDEINRANLSRVFGELMYLLEYRDKEVPLAGGGELAVPPNVRIIGTMNTADRSIALVDHALRRRFAFIPLHPDFEVLRRFHYNGADFDAERLIGLLREINKQINDRNYEIGISFFLHADLGRHLADIWAMEIEPYLAEYFFDQPERLEAFTWDNVKRQYLS